MSSPGMKVEGEIHFAGRDTSRLKNVYALRSRIGVVFPLPVGLPMTVYDNVALSPRLRGINNKADLDVIVQRCLTRAALWDEVKDRLHALGSLLSGGQQQRLTIARALSQEPDLLMLDEFSIAVDPVTTMRIEDVLKELRQEVTISWSPISCSRRGASPIAPPSFSTANVSRLASPKTCLPARSKTSVRATTSREDSADQMAPASQAVHASPLPGDSSIAYQGQM
jgi:ABC-type iron transport system FetAB ATPase subunit